MVRFDSRNTWLPCSYFKRGDTQKQRRFREGTKRTFTNITTAGTSNGVPLDFTSKEGRLHWRRSLQCCPRPLLRNRKGGDRAFCHSAHTRPSMRGEESPFLQEDHMLNPVSLSLTKKSTAARGARNSPKPFRRREREVTTLSITSVAIED